MFISPETSELIEERHDKIVASLNDAMNDTTIVSMTAPEYVWMALYVLGDKLIEHTAQQDFFSGLIAAAMVDQYKDIIFKHSQPRIVSGDQQQPDREVTLTGELGIFVTLTMTLVRPRLTAEYLTKPDAGDLTAIQNVHAAWNTMQPQVAAHVPGFGAGLPTT